jgi:hypothetical protein
MKEFSQSEITTHVRSLFRFEMPVGLRCFAILDGESTGAILADDPDDPAYVVIQEPGDFALFFGGALTATTISDAIDYFRKQNEVVLGFWDDDPFLSQLPSNAYYEGRAIDFTERAMHEGLAKYMQIPIGCSLEPVTKLLFDRLSDSQRYVRIYGSGERALQKGIGYCLMKGNEILCEAFAGPSAEGEIEIGVETNAKYYGNGYATITCANLIHACEEKGYRTFWNAAKENEASVRLARKLGYQKEKEFQVLAWRKSEE